MHAAAAQAPAVAPSPQPQVASPWAPDTLNAIVWADLLGDELQLVSRAYAMRIPPFARGRLILCTTTAKMPLWSMTRDERDANQPAWLQRTSDGFPPYHRMLWTVDDLLHYGWSLWIRENAADGTILNAQRCPFERWEFDAAGRILVDGEPANAHDVILIPGPHEGVLTFGAATIRHAAQLMNAVERVSEAPVPNVELHQTGGDPLTADEIDTLVDAWARARRGENGGVAFTNQSIEVKTHGQAAEQLLIEGRNAAALDIARLLGLPGSAIDATVAKASLNYETTAGRNLEVVDYGCSPYMDAISARLSQDDCVPRGHRVAFDAQSVIGAIPTATGAPTED